MKIYLPYSLHWKFTYHTVCIENLPTIQFALKIYLPYSLHWKFTYHTVCIENLPTIPFVLKIYLPYSLHWQFTYHTVCIENLPTIQFVLKLYWNLPTFSHLTPKAIFRSWHHFLFLDNIEKIQEFWILLKHYGKWSICSKRANAPFSIIF